MAQLDVLLEDDRWSALGLETISHAACSAVLEHADLSQNFEISVLGCDDLRISQLNGAFRDKSEATNVLSWPSTARQATRDGGIPKPPDASDPTQIELGDIAISFDTCARESDAAGKPMVHHVTHLIVHGTLHLLGYDHIRDKDADRMEGLERAILAKMGLPDPYSE
ncbi:MAG: rRNA maturation RNase YbeY [Pseudomonadota bacterium]